MSWIALKMLTGDRGKYLGIVLGIAFASLLIAQQAAIFCGLMSLTSSQIRDIDDAEIWVMDPNVQFVDDIKPLGDEDLERVRGASGVAWAVPLYKGQARARLPGGRYQQVSLIGLDDAHLVGAPDKILVGELSDLWRVDAVMIDDRGFHRLWPDEPLATGKVLEMNDRRAVIVAICRVSKTFQTFPVVYTRYSLAVQVNPPERKMLSFVLAQPKEGRSARQVAADIERQTALKAMTREDFEWMTIEYYLRETGIPFNFGITVALGFVVGTAISAQTFYLFTVENLKQFATLKAMGTGNWRIVGMLLLQAFVVGFLGYSIGVGLAALFGRLAEALDRLAFLMPWQVPALTAIAVMVMVLLSSLLSIRRVLVVEPAVVFQE